MLLTSTSHLSLFINRLEVVEEVVVVPPSLVVVVVMVVVVVVVVERLRTTVPHFSDP